MTTFDRGEGLPGTPVTVLIPSVGGGLWAGTADGQILREQTEFFPTNAAPLILSIGPVLTLQEDAASRLWIGSAGRGLTCLANGVAMNWNTNSGLPGAMVSGLAWDGDGNLWLVTDTGIDRAVRAEVERALQDPRLPLVCREISEAKTTPLLLPNLWRIARGFGPGWRAVVRDFRWRVKRGHALFRSIPVPTSRLYRECGHQQPAAHSALARNLVVAGQSSGRAVRNAGRPAVA